MRSYARSLAFLARARRVSPGGAQTMSKSATAYVEGAMPAFVVRGRGSRVWDVDGNEYLDWVCGLGAVTLGHADPGVDDAVRRQLHAGVSFPVPHVSELALAERLVEAIPCAEMVRFVKTGSEATEAAVRIARAATGRAIVLTCGYHGWHSWFAATRPERPGVPDMMAWLSRAFKYNNLESLDREIEWAEDVPGAYADIENGVAAIILEPALFEPPAPGFLEAVRERATRIGAILIFDEVVCGYRWALAGGQEYFGVTPDLATFGKGMANGLPLACVVGRRDLMEEHGKLISGTHGGEALSLAAGQATLDAYGLEGVIAHLWRMGRLLQDGFNARAEKAGVPFRMSGYPVKPKIVVSALGEFGRLLNRPGPDPELNRFILSLLLQECAERGVLFHPGGLNVCFAHQPTDVEEALEACSGAFQAVLEALSAEDLAGALRGKPYREAFRSNEPDR